MPLAELTPTGPAREQAEPYPREPEVHLRDYWYVILKRRWVIAAVTTGVLALTVAHALIKTPVYTASALLQINRGRLNVVQGNVSPDSWFGSQEFYPTQKRVLGSFTLAERVVDNLELWEHALFAGAGVADGSGQSQQSQQSQQAAELHEAQAGAVLSMLNVSHVRNSQLMQVSFTTPDPQLSANLANSLVAQYIAFSTKNETEAARDTESFFSEQIDRLHREIQEKESALQEYSRREDLVLMDQKESIVVQQLKDLNKQLIRVQGERTVLEARFHNLGKAEPDSMKGVINNPSIQHLKKQQASLHNQVEELSSKFAEDWPELQRTRDTMEKVELRLKRETVEMAGRLVEAARTEYLSVLEAEQLLEQVFEEQKRAAQELNQLTADYDRIDLELDNKKAMLQQLLRRHSESGVNAELGEGQALNVRIVERALVPKGPSGFTYQKSLTWGLGLGFFFAIGVAFFFEYWDSSIHTVDDLRRRVPLPYLGMVPRHDPEEVPVALKSGSNGQMKALASSWRKQMRKGSRKDWNVTWSSLVPTSSTEHSPSYVRSGSVIAERFKFIRGSLLMSNPGGPPKVVLVTGPDKNAGKTFVACNLASSLTELNKKVLIIDADLRNPQVHRVFRVDNDTGLSSMLTGQGNGGHSGIVSTAIPNVSLLPAGPPSPTPSELLASAQMRGVLERCSRDFDFILLDSAPLLPVFDSHVLTTRCDASLLVVRSGQTSYRDVNASLEFIERVGGKVSGVVLNAVDLDDYAHNYYDSYQSYSYGSDSEQSNDRPPTHVASLSELRAAPFPFSE